MWIAHARVDPNSHRLTHLTVDEQFAYGQSSDGSLTAFDAETGKRAWVVQLGAPNRVTFAAVSNADVVIVVSGTTAYGVEKSSGHILWTGKLPSTATTAVYIDEHYFYVGATDGSVYAFDIDIVAYKSDTGRLPGDFDPVTRSTSSPIGPVPAYDIFMWRYRTGRKLTQPPVIAENLLLIGDSYGEVYGITAGSKEELGGKLTFQFKTGQGPTGAMLTRNEIAYIATGDGRVLAVDSSKGQVLWKYSFGHRISGSPTLIDKTIYLTAESDGLRALDAEAGRPVATPNGPWQVSSATNFVAATKNMVYLSDSVGNLVAVDPETAGPRGMLPMVPFKIRVRNDLNDRIYVATKTGTILALKAAGSDKPKFYRNADRTPIDPPIAEDGAMEDEGAADGGRAADGDNQ